MTRTRTLWGAIALALAAPQMAMGQDRDQPVQGSVASIPPIAAPSPTPTSQSERLSGIPAINFSLDGEKSRPAETPPPENAAEAAGSPRVAAPAAEPSSPAPRTAEGRTRAAPAQTSEQAAAEREIAPTPLTEDMSGASVNPPEAVARDVGTPEPEVASDRAPDSGTSNSLFAFLFGAVLLVGAFGLMFWRRRARAVPTAIVDEPEATAPPPQPVNEHAPDEMDEPAPLPEPVKMPDLALASPALPPARPAPTIASSIPAAPGAPVIGGTGATASPVTTAREPAPAATKSGIPLPPRPNAGQPQSPAGLPRFDMFGRPIAGALQAQPTTSRPTSQKPAPEAPKPRKGLVRYDMMGRPIPD